MRHLITCAWILSWLICIIAAFLIIGKFHKPEVDPGDVASLEKYLTGKFRDAVQDKKLGSGGFAIIYKKQIVAERGFGVANHITGEEVSVDSSLYLLASLSKAVTTCGVMKLVESGKISLDEPVLPYLKRWKFSGSDAYSHQVTLRHLLSHTSGLVDGYGHGGFATAAEMQTLEEALANPGDANKGEAHATVLKYAPGTRMSYSSAGYAVVQLVIEEITNKRFQDFMREEIFLLLQMTQSFYDLRDIEAADRQSQLAASYDLNLNPYPARYYTNMAGVSLRSSIHDLALLASAYLNENSVVSARSLTEFSKPQPGTSNSWGLGHTLYSSNAPGRVFGHGGGAFPASGAEFRVDLLTGNAIVMVVSGSQNFVSPLANDWMYWNTGEMIFDPQYVISKNVMWMTIIFISGAVLLLLIRRGKST